MSNKLDTPIDVLKMSVWEEEMLLFFFKKPYIKKQTTGDL